MSDPGKPPRDEADSELRPVIYETLRKLASAYLRKERSDHTLQPTALVHEAWLRLGEDAAAQKADETHFLALASQAMRRILVDYARTRGAAKRGGNWNRVSLSMEAQDREMQTIDVLALHEALGTLETASERQAQIVEMRIFGGLSNAEIAKVFDVSESTVAREWRVAQAWLIIQLRDHN